MLKELFRGEHIYLAAPRAEDMAILQKWGEDSEFMRFVDTEIAHPAAAKLLQPETSMTAFEFRIRLLETDALIGFVGIHNIEWNNQTGTIGIGIGERLHQSKGYGKEALALILQYAFCELNLYRVGLDVISYNTRAIAAYERVGFQVEGQLRGCIYRDGVRYDRVYMGITRPEWEMRSLTAHANE